MTGSWMRNACVRRDLGVGKAGSTDVALPLAGAADLIISALLGPGSLDAVEFIAAIRRDPRTAAKPIVVVTACTFSHQLERARRAGADLVLLKPCVPNMVVL